MNYTLFIGLCLACIACIPYYVMERLIGWMPLPIRLLGQFQLVILYWIWVPSEWKAFRLWPGWSLMRENWLHTSFHGPGKALMTEGKDATDTKQYCYAVHPHGLYSISLIFGIALNPKQPDIVAFGASLLFKTPILKELDSWGGARAATRENVLYHLQQGDDIVLAPGGMAEIPGLVPEWTGPNEMPETEYYRNWKIDGVVRGRGFLKYATTCGNVVHIVPIYAQDEDDLYKIWIISPKIQRWLLSTWFPRYCWPVFSMGHRWWCWFWPKRPLGGSLRIWVGEPMDLSDCTLLEAEERFYKAMSALRQMAESDDNE